MLAVIAAKTSFLLWNGDEWLVADLSLQQNKMLATLSPEFIEMLAVCEIPQFGNTGLEGFQGPLFWSEISTILGFQSWEVTALTQAFLRPLLSCPFSQKQEVWEKGCMHWELLLLSLILNNVTTSRKKDKSIYHCSTTTSLFTFLSGSCGPPGNYFAEKNIHYF